MDQYIRELERQFRADPDNLELRFTLERALKRVGRRLKGPSRYKQPIPVLEALEIDFDKTWFHRKMSWGILHRMSGCMKWCPPWCCWPYSYQFDYRGVRHRWARMRRPKRHTVSGDYGHRHKARPGSGKGKYNNSKRKTLRTHRNPRAKK